MLQSQVNYWTLQENKRHNLETERLGFEDLAERVRHNKVSEQQGQANIDLGFANLDESKRHSLVTEGIQKIQSDIAMGNLYESMRHNKAQESIGKSQVELGYAQVGLGYSQLAETQRHNEAYEAEINRHNTEVENSQRFQNVTGFAGQLNTANQKQMDYDLTKSTKERELDLKSRSIDVQEGQAFGNLFTHSGIRYTSPIGGNAGGYIVPEIPALPMK